MGYGDWIMSMADVRRANEATGKKVKLGNGHSMYIDDQVMKYNPRLAAKADTDVVWVPNYPAHRPYIKATDGKRITFNDDFRPEPGELYFKGDELLFAAKQLPKQFIVVEPNVKNKYAHTVNKAWCDGYWDQLLKTDLPWIQLGDTGTSAKTRQVVTENFRQALSVLKRATLFVGTDGGLHHAAAAMGIPAVVIWTGFTSPKHLGYDSHVNVHDGDEPCGWYAGKCRHCRKKAEAILPDYVQSLVEAEYEKHSRHLVT